MGFPNHAKQGMGLYFAVYYPAGIKDFVPAMFRIGLRKHHQFNIGGIAPRLTEMMQQIINFIV